MRQSVSLITIGVSGYQKANGFYALGWKTALEIDETAFFQEQPPRSSAGR